MAAMARMVVVAVMVGMVRTDCGTTMESATFGDFRRCSSREVKASLQSQASCSPRPMVVRLPWPNSTMVGGGVRQMTPTHVTVMQCGGGCHRGSQGCLPTSTRQRQVSVMVGKCGVSVGKCDKECAVVRVEEHTQCGCGCQLERATCEAKGLHRFREEVCSCECREVEGKRRCLEQGRTWEEETCTCGCSSTTSCPPGWMWEKATCSCISAPTLQGNLEKSSRAKVEEEVMSWELMIIICLLAVLAVLVLLVVVLAVRLRVARVQERKAGQVLLVPSTLAGHYVPCTDPCSDLGHPGKAPRKASEGAPALSDTASDKPDRTEPLTDSSLCSSEQCQEVSGGSSESLASPRATGSQPCLQSVHLSRHLAIRPGPEGGSLRLPRPHRHLQPYPGPGQPHPSPPALQPYQPSSPAPYTEGRASPLQPLPCPTTYYSGSSPYGGEAPSSPYGPPVPESPYNTVRIVYRKGERRMELSCQVEEEGQGCNITENPGAYHM